MVALRVHCRPSARLFMPAPSTYPSPGDSMPRSADHPTIQIEADGRPVASAEVHPTDEPGLVHSDLHVESGHLPAGTRSRLVDAVLEHPEVEEADRLIATMPLGDTEMLDRV